MINGRRQDHGFERAQIEVIPKDGFYSSPLHMNGRKLHYESFSCVNTEPTRILWQVFEGGKPVKCNPLAWWTFKDCFQYLETEQLEKHPLHDQVIA